MQYDTPANLLYRPMNEFVEDFVGADRALKGLQLIRVKEVMRSSPPTVKADEKAEAARQRMEQEGINWLVVVNDGGKFLGWVDKADLGKGEMVREVMSPSATTATVDTVLNEALSFLLSHGLDNLAIVDEDNRLQGVLSFDIIRKALTEVTQRRQSE